MRKISVTLFRKLIQEQMFKYFLSTALTSLFFSAVKPLCSIGRRHFEEYFCEIILDLDQ